MNISGYHPWDAVRDGLLSEPQTNNLWEYLLEKTEEVPYFRMAHILYHLGGFIAMVVMTFFMNLGREGFGGRGIFVIVLTYTLFGLLLAEHFSKKRGVALSYGNNNRLRNSACSSGGVRGTESVGVLGWR